MDVDFELSDIDSALESFESDLRHEMEEVGKAAVIDAADRGTYQDRTGELRKSNAYEVLSDGLVLSNSKEYASYVESKGFKVLTEAVIEAQSKLEKL
jgi:hypothetical protein